MRAVGLFDGVGMISHAASMLGYDKHMLCEKEPYQRSVLAKRFTGATITEDVCELHGSDLGDVDLMHGGSPCQGFSVAGLGEALDDPRSKLIMEFVRLVDEAQPRVVLIENVAVLRSRGLSVVVDALVRAGYLCWWDCVPALAVGAPHLRDRVWITAVHWDEMPDLDGRPFKEATTKLPRAGALTRHGLVELEPSATIKAAKEAMGAVKQEDGTTWLTRLDSPLFPTPSAASYGSNQGGAAGRVGPPRHSLESMARNRLWPTPERSDATGGRVSKELGGRRPSGAKRDSTLGTAIAHEQRLWPTAGARDYKDMALGDGAIGRGQLPEAVRDSLGIQQLLPSPRSSDGERGGRGDLIQVVRGNKATSAHGDQRMWPTPASADGTRGPGRSDHRAGGPNLRTAVDENHGRGPLNPYWVEWLMGMPIGWTDVECDITAQFDWTSEYGLPRVLADVPRRKERLMSIGNACLWQIAYLRIAQAHERLGIPLGSERAAPAEAEAEAAT